MDFADAREAPEHLMPGRQNFLASGYRAITVMPMMRGETAIGAISVIHRQPRQLSDKQRELLRDLRRAGRHRHREHAAVQRTATNRSSGRPRRRKCCSVISSSPGELEPVFTAMLANATRICRANFGTMYLYEQSNGAFCAACDAQCAAGLCRETQARTGSAPFAGHPMARDSGDQAGGASAPISPRTRIWQHGASRNSRNSPGVDRRVRTVSRRCRC